MVYTLLCYLRTTTFYRGETFLSTALNVYQNSFNEIGYNGPMPPAGQRHRYFFKVYALDKMLGLESGADKEDVLRAIKGHVLAEGELMGTYQRQ